ncbi:MAG: hypothetical protein WCG13_01540 [Burkholderiales bacterium]
MAETLVRPRLSAHQKQRLNTHGYVIIDDFLPPDLYQRLLGDLKSSASQITYQVRPAHYSHVFSSELMTLPRPDEPYIAKFSLIRDQRQLGSLQEVFSQHLGPVMKEATEGEARYALFPGAVRVRGGDVYRAHQDGYAGIVGYSLFLNEGWCWDYGGILTYVRDEDTAEPVFPRSNRLLLRNERFKHFHFLNTVEQHCPKEQYLILGWADAQPGEASAVRGEYWEF